MLRVGTRSYLLGIVGKFAFGYVDFSPFGVLVSAGFLREYVVALWLQEEILRQLVACYFTSGYKCVTQYKLERFMSLT